MRNQLPVTSTIDPIETSDLTIGGLVPMSCEDYPGCLSAVIFCQGCPWRCRYCHNSHLQQRTEPEGGLPNIKTGYLSEFLQKRQGFLDAVVFSGGEASLQPGIEKAMQAVAAMGFKVGLHTAAPSLEKLLKLLPYLSWVGLDIKALPEDYASITQIHGSGKDAFLAAELLINSNIDFEIRTTATPAILSSKQIMALADKLKSMGVKNYALQLFRPQGCQDKELLENRASYEPELFSKLASGFHQFTLRKS